MCNDSRVWVEVRFSTKYKKKRGNDDDLGGWAWKMCWLNICRVDDRSGIRCSDVLDSTWRNRTWRVRHCVALDSHGEDTLSVISWQVCNTHYCLTHTHTDSLWKLIICWIICFVTFHGIRAAGLRSLGLEVTKNFVTVVTLLFKIFVVIFIYSYSWKWCHT